MATGSLGNEGATATNGEDQSTRFANESAALAEFQDKKSDIESATKMDMSISASLSKIAQSIQ
jgi:hypothetical protein